MSYKGQKGMGIDMSNIESLNTEYTKVIEIIEVLRVYHNRVLEENKKFGTKSIKTKKNLGHLQKLSEEIDCTGLNQLMDTMRIGKQYMACLDAIQEYKSTLLQADKLDEPTVLSVSAKVISAQKAFDNLKISFGQQYNYVIDSEDALSSAITVCIGNTIYPLQKRADQLKAEAKGLLGEEYATELHRDDAVQHSDSLPEKLFVAKYPLKKISMPLLKDIGMKDTYQNVDIDLKNQGNILIKVDYTQLEDAAVDKFVLSYIFKYIEAFPLGTVNVHIFDQNTNYLYKRLCNIFQSENVGEITRKTVQLHTDIRTVSVFRDVNCEDIYKKSSVNNPDLYSIYEHDKTDPFNLIVLRDGIIDSSGNALTEVLDTVRILTKPGDIGHRCGLRFLIFDNSSSFEKNLMPNTRHLISQIQQNCELRLDYVDGKYLSDGKEVKVLQIEDNLDAFVQERSQHLANVLNNKEQNYVSFDEIAANNTEEGADYIMFIPVGKSGSNVAEIPFSCKDEKGTVAGQCIGYMIIGQSGSGKSSFFHSLVLNGCMKYSPRDLQFWLLDFKNGGASSKYNNSGIPHIRMIAKDNKIDDALCLFQMVREEMLRRIGEFNKNFTDNIVDYNRIAKVKGFEYFPRIIIAIDEVQEIFREDSASALQKLISSIASLMRSSGMHFVMVAQNLSEGKSYMLKDAFLPSASGRISFRVAPDIPRDSGFTDDFIQRRQEIAELKTGEAYIGYGIGTIKKVKMAYISPEEMNSKCFVDIRNKYTEYSDMKPLVIGNKDRLTINASLQGKQGTYIDTMKKIEIHQGLYTAVIGEDAYRMSPLKIYFSQNANSHVLLLGSDRQISSSLCASIAISLLRQNVRVHLFNGDKSIRHSFMYVCQNINVSSTLMQNHRLCEFKDVMKEFYSEYMERRGLVQTSDNEIPEFSPLFLVVNDLFNVESFTNNEMVEYGSAEASDEEIVSSGLGVEYNIFMNRFSDGDRSKAQPRESIQNIMSALVKNGWRYNLHVVMAINGDSSTWRGSYFVSEDTNAVLFNTTGYADQFEDSYFLKEMLKNISNEGEGESMAVWASKRTLSKIRPIIYEMSERQERRALESLMKGE